MVRRPAAALALSFVVSLATPAAWAQGSYPVPAVTLVTHSSPGGGSDVFVRTLAKYLGPKMGVELRDRERHRRQRRTRGGAGRAGAGGRLDALRHHADLHPDDAPQQAAVRLRQPDAGGHRVLRPRGALHARAVAASRRSPKRSSSRSTNRGKARWGAANPASLERIAMERLNRVTQARGDRRELRGRARPDAERPERHARSRHRRDPGDGVADRGGAGAAARHAHGEPVARPARAADGEGAGRRRSRHQVSRARRPEEPAAQRAEGLAATASRRCSPIPRTRRSTSARASCRR